jgi:two-component system, chemotaxis family, protein-glutamate methylesterase/glutaminase
VGAEKLIRVLIVDDSALVRRILTEIFATAPDIEVVGAAADPLIARDKIKELNPDVLTLDVEMPRMDGLTFLRNLMRLRPMPVVMVSSLTERGAETTLKALELGAFDFVAKPKIDIAGTLSGFSEEILGKVRAAARARVQPRIVRDPVVAAPRPPSVTGAPTPKLSADAVLPQITTRTFRTTDRLVALGASTGGTEAIREVLERLPPDAPAIVISQHIPQAFSGPFARRMDSVSRMSVSEASDGTLIVPGHVYIAPGDRHLLVERDGARWRCRLHDGPPVNRHRPAVDVMFRSVAQSAGTNALGILLTGMGDDGARGLKELQQAGAPTIAQDEATSVVWGMPGAAVKLGAADRIVPLGEVADALMAWALGATDHPSRMTSRG